MVKKEETKKAAVKKEKDSGEKILKDQAEKKLNEESPSNQKNESEKLLVDHHEGDESEELLQDGVAIGVDVGEGEDVTVCIRKTPHGIETWDSEIKTTVLVPYG